MPDAPEGTPTPEPAKTFTQAEVDAMILQRAKRVAAEQFPDYNDLKTKAAKLDEIEAETATALEKAVKKAREEGRTEAQTATNAVLVAAEARALAAEAKFRNPTLAVKAVDLSAVKVGPDGKIDAGAIKALLVDLAKDEPYLIDDGKARPQPDPSQGSGGDGKPNRAQEGAEEAQRRFGKPAGQ